ncbi:MAG: nuclear transport factor 2 family protein [Janthinobacterium lividum]
MSGEVAKQFIEALRTLEETRDAEPLASLYAEAASVGNVIAPDQFHGQDGARQFWNEYRGTFDTAKSTFRSVIAGDGSAALEWQTEGTSFEGQPFKYSGVTILEIDSDQVTRSSAYFDPKALGRQIKE